MLRRPERLERARDADALPAYYASLETVANVIRDLVLTCPPNVGDGMTMMLDALRQGRHVAALTIEQQRDVLDLFTKSARGFLDSWFESDPVKAAVWILPWCALGISGYRSLSL